MISASNFKEYINTYIDTRGFTTEDTTFTRAIIQGIALGGGLFVPRVLPKLSLEEIVALGDLRYSKQAAHIFRRFGVDLPDDIIDSLMTQAYGENFDAPAIAPIAAVTEDTFVLELWHGPTSAFKDLALQCLPVFFSAAIDKQRGADHSWSPAKESISTADTGASPYDSDYLILVATSGDTGKAALEGFKDRNHTNIIVFYPNGGVSDIQLRQMTTQLGNNVAVFGVDGNFDDCQTAVKAAFNDKDFNDMLLEKYNLRLSSANSINWGRLLPQIIYYVSAYAQMVKRGDVAAGSEIDVCVPTGNFGNILGAYYAAEIGVPLGRLLCASNENRVLADFINTGVYDISERAFVLTPSPSMDILVSSNLERQLFELTGRNAEAIRGWMDDLKTTGRFQVDKDTFAKLRQNYSADWVSNADCLQTIREVYEAHNYLIDPHTAVAWKVAERLRSTNPVLVVSTAHWAKFGTDVYRALNGIKPGEPIEESFTQAGVTGLIEHIKATYNAGSIPAPLAELNNMEVRFKDSCGYDVEDIKAAVVSWLDK